MYQALYRKYRPQTFNDVIAQDVVKKILINSIKNNKVSHAYLFSGPRGIGKTSIAKIFSKAVNCQNFLEKEDICLKCDNCLSTEKSSIDILEIDAASNNGVDQIRDLKSKVSIVPSVLKYKVYIIDEVHMLSNSAFNALLKTLEEPPSHVIFILATTEFFSVPETIVSRCQCFNFTRITIDDLTKRMDYIAKSEKIKVTDEVLRAIAEYSNGGLRDAISMLDKLSSFTNGNITIDDFTSINGLVSYEDVIKTYNDLQKGKYLDILGVINKINDSGYDFANFIERLMIYAKDEIISNYVNGEKKENLEQNLYIVEKLNKILNELKETLNPLIIVQVYLLEITNYLTSNNAISQENLTNFRINEEKMIYDKKIEKSQKNEKNIKKVEKNGLVDVKQGVVVNDEMRRIRINNALCNANLAFKKEFVSKWTDLQKYRLEDKYAKVVQLLDLSSPMIVSDKYVVLTSDSEAIVERMFFIYEDVERLFSLVYNNNYRVVFMTTKDFEIVKNKYINDKKNGIIYKYQEEVDKLVNKKEESNELLSKAVSIFGSDLVDVEED